MANTNEGVAALKSLGTHAEPILDAYLNQKGQLQDHLENEKVVRALLKHHLVWRYEDDEGVRLNGDLLRLLSGVTRDFRRGVADETIGDLWSLLQEQMAFYKESKIKGDTKDRELYSGRVQEHCFELIEAMRLAIIQFSHYISSGFAYVSNLDTRAKENISVIKRAKRLNDILETFSIEQFERDAGADPMLRRLLLKQLPKAIEQCNKELIHAIKKLGDILHKIRQDQHLAKMINRFAAKYDSDRGFSPDIEGLSNIPQVLNLAPSLMGKVQADIYDAEQEDALAEMCQGLRAVVEGSAAWEVSSETGVDDATDQEPAEAEPNPLYDMALKALDFAQVMDTPLSAMAMYQEFKELDIPDVANCSPQLWLLTLANTLYAQPMEIRKQLKVNFQETNDPLYPDVYYVQDLTLEWHNHAQ